jgi:hypothetical protein
MSIGDLVNILGVADARFQAVDQVETWIGKTTVHDISSDSISVAGPGHIGGNQVPATRDRASAAPTTRS